MADGLDGGEIISMTSTDSMLFAISFERGIYRKDDMSDWELVIDDPDYELLETAGNCIFACGMGAPTIRSFDQGVTWEHVSFPFNITRIYNLDTVTYFGQQDYTIYRSYDYGTTLDTLQFPINDGLIFSIYTDDTLLYFYTYDGSNNKYIFYSDNYGDTWIQMPNNGLFDQYDWEIKHFKYLNGSFWIQQQWAWGGGISPQPIFIYDTNQTTWIEVTNNLSAQNFYTDLYEYNGDILLGIWNAPVYKFNYADSSWTPFSDSSKNLRQFLTYKEDLFCATDQGPCTIDTNGVWNTFYDGLQNRDITSISTHNNKIYVTANNELFCSENDSIYTKVEGAYGFQIITTDSIFYMLSSREFRISKDTGQTWKSYSTNLQYDPHVFLRHFSVSQEYCYISSNRGLYRSPTDSINWTKIITSPFGETTKVVKVETIDHTVIASDFLGSYGIYFSNNNGITFSYLDEYSRFSTIDQTYYLFRDSIYYSNDYTQTWQSIPIESDWNSPYCIARKGDSLIIGGDKNGVPVISLTYNHGQHWIDIKDDLPIPYYGNFSKSISTIEIIDGKIFVGNPKSGLWYRDDLLTGTIEDPPSNFSDNTFINVYPIPLSSATTFNYTLQGPTTVQICIYNQIGEQVEVIWQQQNSGKQQVIWNAEGLPSGVYFYRMQAGEQVSLGKMVLVR